MKQIVSKHRARALLAIAVISLLVLGNACAPSQPGSSTQPQPTAAAAQPKKGGTLLIGQDFGPQHFDPHKSTAWANTNITESIYDGLLQWNQKETELLPNLATSWTISPDGLVYTFKIRQGVKFHNGRVMTTADVKFSLDRMRDAKSGSLLASNFALVQSVDVVDGETVKVTLSKPQATFLNFLTEVYPIVPPEAVAELEQKPVGTGPFKLDKYVLNQSVRLVRNPDYWDKDKPYLDTVEFKILGDEASKESALRSKSVDMAWFRDPRQADALAKSVPGVLSAPGIPSRWIGIRLNTCQKPFDSVEVRRALSLSADRKALIETVIPARFGGAIGTVIAPADRFYVKADALELPNYKNDVAQAKSLLTKAGYADGITVDAYKVVAANQLDVDGAQVLKEQWAKAGIKVNIVPMEVAQIIDDWNKGNGKMIQVGGVWNADPDGQLYNWFHSSTPTAKAYCINDPELDKLLDQGRTSTDLNARTEIYQNVQKRIADQAYVFVLYGYPLRWEMWWDYVKGYANRTSNTRFALRYAWLDKATP
jgi:peptide/nickel transport system substrate-binding protein